MFVRHAGGRDLDADSRELAVALERLEQRVWTDAFAAATPEVGRSLGLAVEPVADGLALMASRFPHVLYNRTFAFGLDAPIDEATLDRAIALYRRDAPFTIQPSPVSRPPEIGHWLNARGIESYFDWVIWARETRAPIPDPTGLRVDRIGRERASAWIDLASTIFVDEAPFAPWFDSLIGRPSWNHYVAYDGETPIGIGAMFVEGGLGWLGWGGTLPGHRRRGVQGAMIARRVKDAAAAGARWVRVETAADLPEKPNPSYRNMPRAGFRLLYLRPSYAYVPAGRDPAATAPGS